MKDWRITCRSKNYVQIEDLSAYLRSIPSADRGIICKEKNCLWIKEISGDQRGFFRSKNYLPNTKLPGDPII